MKQLLAFITFLGIANFGFAQTWEQRGSNILGVAELDNFGEVTAMNSTGDVIAVTAPANADVAIGSGKVQIFQWTEWAETGWEQMGEDIDGEAILGGLTMKVDLSDDGQIVAISSPSVSEIGDARGSTRIFQWNGSDWEQKGSTLIGEADSDRMGESLALSGDGNIVVVGSSSNYVKAYIWDESDWVQLGENLTSTDESEDAFGISATTNSDGTIIAVGSPLSSNLDGDLYVGKIQVFNWDGSEWNQMGDDIFGLYAYDRFGLKLAMNSSGETFVTGSSRINEDFNQDDGGPVAVFEWDGSNWARKGNYILNEGSNNEEDLGSSVTISSDGNTIVAGARRNGEAGENSGAAKPYLWNGSIWEPIGVITGEDAADNCGTSVEISSDGTIIVIGSPNNSEAYYRAGQVRVFHIWSVGIEENLNNFFSFYPNPTRDILNVSFALSNSEQTQVNVLDISGKVIHQVNLGKVNGQTNISVSLNQISAGTYFIELLSSEGKQVERFIKE